MPFKNIEITPSQYNQNYTNKRTQIYKGFSTVNSTSQSSKLYDFDLVKQNLLNHFNTKKGSRVMNPEFGTIIWDLIMEPLTEDNKNLLLTDIKTICNFDPRSYPLKININEYEKGFLIEITMNMKNTDQTEVIKLAFDQQLGLQVQ